MKRLLVFWLVTIIMVTSGFTSPATAWQGTEVDSGLVSVQTEDVEMVEIHAKALGDYECNSLEWHFVINQIERRELAPASIWVRFSNKEIVEVSLWRFSGKVAHYVATENLDQEVEGAWTNIYASWSGQFNLSHGPCHPPPPPTMPPPPTPTVTPTEPPPTPTVTPTEPPPTPTVTPTVTPTEPAPTPVCPDCVDLEPGFITGEAPFLVNFTIKAFDPDGLIEGYGIDYGDGAAEQGDLPQFSHVYKEAGTYHVSAYVLYQGRRIVGNCRMRVQVTKLPPPPTMPPPTVTPTVTPTKEPEGVNIGVELYIRTVSQTERVDPGGEFGWEFKGRSGAVALDSQFSVRVLDVAEDGKVSVVPPDDVWLESVDAETDGGQAVPIGVDGAVAYGTLPPRQGVGSHGSGTFVWNLQPYGPERHLIFELRVWGVDEVSGETFQGVACWDTQVIQPPGYESDGVERQLNPDGTYAVKQGDTVAQIAKSFEAQGATIWGIIAANGLKLEANGFVLIEPGWVLTIT